jgi:predicted PurR-regulated permease PerM
MAITAYTPFMGAALVWFPAAIYLAIQGVDVQSAVLVIAGIVLAVVIDGLARNIIAMTLLKTYRSE